jgi:hypothetical protein
MNALENRQQIVNLHEAIKASIIIPPQLAGHLFYSTTGLGGLFLNYRSNTSSQLAMHNSKVHFCLYFHTTDGQGRFRGEDVGLEVSQKRNIVPLRGVNKPLHYSKVVDRVNKWVQENIHLLVLSLEN